MPYYSPEQIKKAKQMSLLTYLQSYEPNELVRDSQIQYSTKTHSSLKVSNGYWNWFSKGIGGRNAVDYLEKVKGYSFIEAIQIILDKEKIQAPIYIEKQEKQKKVELILPEKNSTTNQVKNYLMQRGIDIEIIQKCIEEGLIYEEKYYHNVVFLGYDKNKKPRYAGCRATNGSMFKNDATGSDKGYSFMLEAQEKTDTIHIFEGATDTLSYATLFKLYGQKYEDKTMISLAGVYQPARIIEESKIPLVIQNYLKQHPEVKKIVLCLDNDQAGRNASKALQIVLSNKYEVINRPPKKGKDYNEYLCDLLGIKLIEKNKKINKEAIR